jgi:hypothetical protein
VRGIKSSVSFVLAVGLLAGSAVGVTAQEADPTAQGPVEFTAMWSWGPDVRPDTIEAGEGVVMTRGGAWRPGVITTATDPRLEGAVTIAANSNQYLGGPEVWTYAFRIENDGGAWQQLPTINLDTGLDDSSTTTGVLVGEGGYEGLVAVFDNLSQGQTWTLHGYIIEGELPPDPEPYVAE